MTPPEAPVPDSPAPRPRRALQVVVFALLAALAGCRDSPSEVIEGASEAASTGRIVDVQSAFSIATVQRLERAWKLNRELPEQGWSALAARLVFDGKPLEVLREDIQDDHAQVWARAGATERDYYLRKEDGRWRIDLGGGLGYRRAKARLQAEADKAEADEKRKEHLEELKEQRAEQEKGGA
ncbi:MAG: hypothetical protein H6706_15900 [Myxococcales bacterium]|nr:hypothetical protein [Myxococcales bacterium]